MHTLQEKLALRMQVISIKKCLENFLTKYFNDSFNNTVSTDISSGLRDVEKMYPGLELTSELRGNIVSIRGTYKDVRITMTLSPN